MAVLITQFQFLDNNGNPLDSGKIYTYEAGSSTPATTYQDSDETTPQANPIILDGAGRPTGGAIWLDSALEYKLVIKDSSDVTLQTIDDVSAGGNLFAAGIQLGGNLDVNGNLITSSSNGDVVISPHGTGKTDIHNFEAQTNVDLNGFDLIMDDGTSIIDENSNEQLTVNTTASAVNNIGITNAATGNAPKIAPEGTDSNINLDIESKGTGTIELKDNTNVTGELSADVTLTVDGSSSSAGKIRLAEDTDNGTNYIGIKAPATVSSSVELILPDGDGSAGQRIETDGSANLTWSTDDYIFGGSNSGSSTSSISLTGLSAISTGDYDIVVTGRIAVLTDSVDLSMEILDDNGSPASMYATPLILDYFDGTSWTRNTTGSEIAKSADLNDEIIFEITLLAYSAGTGAFRIIGDSVWLDTGGVSGTDVNQGKIACRSINSSDSLDEIKVSASSGNISGELRYHLRKIT